MSQDIAIQVKNLSKKYILKHPVKDADDKLIQEHWALHDVSFEIKKGEAVGIIGPNGSGKSTLLKIMSGVTKPTSGSVEISGRVASILDIGAGFHPELSGRENVFLNGQLLGFSKKEIKDKYHEIIAFSGIERFIEEPVKNYSNGMYLRLAFSILAHLDFDIYLFDEVMSVGDASFQIKVKQFLENKRKNNHSTFVFVSHQLAEIQNICNQVYLLNKGQVMQTDAVETIEKYIDDSFDKDRLPPNEKNFENNELPSNEFFDLKSVYVALNTGKDLLVSNQQTFGASFILKQHTRVDISFGVENLIGNELFYTSTLLQEEPLIKTTTLNNIFNVMVTIPDNILKRGKYILSITLIVNKKTIISRLKSCYFELINKESPDNNLVNQRPNVALIGGSWIVRNKK